MPNKTLKVKPESLTATSIHSSVNIPTKDTRIRHGESSSNASGGKEKGSNEGKKGNPRSRGEPHGAVNESKAAQSVTRVKKNNKILGPKKNATHEDESDPETWDHDAEDFRDHNGQSVAVPQVNAGNRSNEKDKEDEEDEEETAQREEFLARGREENRKLRHGGNSPPRPQPIEKQWRSLYIVVKTFWTNSTKELNSHQLKTIHKIQSQIKNECETIVQNEFSSAGLQIQALKLDELSRKYEFPIRRIHGLISSAAAALNEVKQLENHEAEEILIEKQNSLLEGFAVIMEVLNEYQIPVPCVVTQNAIQMFDDIVNKNEDTKRKYAETIAELNEPMAEQKQAWTVAIPEMEKALEVMKTDESTATGKRQLEAHIGKIESENKLLESNNKELGLIPTMNSLPIALLQRMQHQWIDNKRSELADSWTDLVKTLEDQSLAKTLHKRLYTQQKGKMKLGETDSGSSTPAESSQTSSGNRISPSTVPNIPDGSDRLASATPQHSTSEKDYLSMQFSESDAISVPDYSSGITEFGKLAAVRLSHTSNPKFSRFIVKAGTSSIEHYHVIRGTDLGPGGAEALEDCDGGSFHFTFDLRTRKRALKTNGIAAVGPCVIMSRAEGYIPGPKTRRPDTYVKIKYANDSIDWVTRTELIQLAGKTYAEKKLATLEEKYKEKVEFFEAHKNAGVHPETKQPLDPKDRELMPWLFPEGGPLEAADTKRTDGEEDEDTNMDLDKIETNT